MCGLASLCNHSAREICRWKGGGGRRRCGGGGDVMCCPIGSEMGICRRYKQRKTKTHLSFIYKIAIAIHYSLPSCLIRFPYRHACIPFSSPRCLHMTHSARHLQYKRAIVICYITDNSWRKCHLLDHEYNAVAMTLVRQQPSCAQVSALARDGKGQKVQKGSNIVGPYIPYDLLQTKGETCAKFD